MQARFKDTVSLETDESVDRKTPGNEGDQLAWKRGLLEEVAIHMGSGRAIMGRSRRGILGRGISQLKALRVQEQDRA